MVQSLSVEDAKSHAIQLAGNVSFGNWGPEGITLTTTAAEAFRQVGLSALVEPVNDSRLSPSGNPLDLYAPSAWHALCAVLFQDIRTRLVRGTYDSALANIDETFGKRPFYRGQARAWDIIPSAWRSPRTAAAAGDLLEKFRVAVRSHLTVYPDPISRLMGRPDLDHVIGGLAQHYGLPTNLIDMTFNPMVAMAFACNTTHSPGVLPRDLNERALESCGLVYVIAAPALVTVARPTFEFPPSYSLRLYQQKGLFVDFGELLDGDPSKRLEDYSARWCWLQQNCQRIFFPRTFPVMEGADELRDHELMEGDEFLCEIANRVQAGLRAGPADCAAKPPWIGAIDDMEWASSQTAKACSRIDAYLRRASLVKFEDGDALDPLLVGLLQKWVAPELDALSEWAEMGQHSGLDWISARLKKAKQALKVPAVQQRISSDVPVSAPSMLQQGRRGNTQSLLRYEETLESGFAFGLRWKYYPRPTEGQTRLLAFLSRLNLTTDSLLSLDGVRAQVAVISEKLEQERTGLQHWFKLGMWVFANTWLLGSERYADTTESIQSLMREDSEVRAMGSDLLGCLQDIGWSPEDCENFYLEKIVPFLYDPGHRKWVDNPAMDVMSDLKFKAKALDTELK